MQIHKFLPPAAMLIAGTVNAATPTPKVVTLYIFLKERRYLLRVLPKGLMQGGRVRIVSLVQWFS